MSRNIYKYNNKVYTIEKDKLYVRQRLGYESVIYTFNLNIEIHAHDIKILDKLIEKYNKALDSKYYCVRVLHNCPAFIREYVRIAYDSIDNYLDELRADINSYLNKGA